jgi:selenocysteine-specific elongation factor
MTHLVVGTAGHIDHGKSTLVHALTGIDPDRLKEEKARGITIELGFAHTTLSGDAETTIAFVDVPGHERFVRTMLAGAGGIDCVLLIVAADESVMPQTREHFDICRLLHIKHGIVVLTKADAVDEETLDLVRLEVRDLVTGSFLEQAPVIAVSAKTGAGLDQLRMALANVARRSGARPEGGAARLPIDRVFTMQGFGTVVTGTLVAGQIRVDEELAVVPGELRVRVRGVQVHAKKRGEAVSGQRVAVNVGGVDVQAMSRGQTLIAPGTLTLSRRLDVLVDLLPATRALRHGARVRFHQGTAELLGRISLPAAMSELPAGKRTTARIRLESPAAVTRGDRFILRAYSPPVTIGGGEVLDPDPPRVGVRTPAGEQRLAALTADGEKAVLQMVADTGGIGLPVTALVARAGLTPAAAEAMAAALDARGQARRLGDRLVSNDVVRTLSDQLRRVVTEHHRTAPLTDGIPREEARERVFARAHGSVFEHVVSALHDSKVIVGRERLALATHRLELPPDEASAYAAIEAAYKRAGLKPLDAARVAADARTSPTVAEKMTALLVRQKRLVRIDTLMFHADVLQQLKADVQALKSGAPGGQATVDVGMFKDRFAVTRKFAIPLLEWLDRERVTRRVGEKRIVL